MRQRVNTIKLKFDTSWTYAPAPESKSAATINKQYDLFINGEWQKPSSKKYFDTINPANEEKLSEIADANAADVDKAVKAARNAYEKVWKKMPAKERAKYIFRIARMVQEKARELAIIETLDGGKPIRESRDFDVPTAANHFFYYAGWADKLEYAFPNRHTQAIGCCRTNHSLEFSFADGCMENCTGYCNRKYGCIETCRNNSAHRIETC